MSDLAIRVENLNKAYRIGLKEQQHETLIGAMGAFIRSPFQNYRNLRKLSQFDDVTSYNGKQKTESGDGKSPSTDQSQLSAFNCQLSPKDDIIWALRDISFEVKHGEVLGIIGRNGAGKSTLLRILSRITEPTSGHAEIHGRVASLLEVGTGFHPDLTGRENTYLNGTILGMRKHEIDSKFDEIVDFSGVEKFIDTPVKRYSSGMRVRLAFAVAAHLEPEILVIDEVLAVGDAEFQKKCLGKMEDVASLGRTVLFVSHNMAAVTALTSRTLFLSEGTVAAVGPTADIISHYLSLGDSDGHEVEWTSPRPGDGSFEFLRAEIRSGSDDPDLHVKSRVEIHISFSVLQTLHDLMVGVDLVSSEGVLVFSSWLDPRSLNCGEITPGEYRVVCIIPQDLLNAQRYNIGLRAGIPGIRRICVLDNCLSFSVNDFRDNRSKYDLPSRGLLNPKLEWHLLGRVCRS